MTPSPPKPGAIDESTIRQALYAGELEYFYQPKVNFINVCVSGAEALIRWRQPDGGQVAPAEFIPIAEQSGLITDIVTGMFPRLLDDIAVIEKHRPGLQITFNASPLDFASDELTNLILDALADRHIKPGQLGIELTETASARDIDELAEKLGLLASHGIGISMDDFGTGYSSLDLLSKLPFTCVKLDQGMVRRIAQSSKSAAVVEASIKLAHNMKINIMAEGIECASEFGDLIKLGCQQAQGYWISPPLPLMEFVDFTLNSPRWGCSPATQPSI